MYKKLPTFLILAFAAAGSAGVSHAQLGKQQGLLEANTAKTEAIAALPHFDDESAAELVAERPFLSMTELNDHLDESLEPEQLEEVYGKLFLHLDLNTAPEAEILMIPGAGDRMAHEFNEYRPYKSLEQFRREIGKYVDEDEVARLEQYVFLPIDLNTADDAAILTIPGVGPKMLHEFKEYRPYTNIAQFRKEIGKYVDEAEVARLERYVSITE